MEDIKNIEDFFLELEYEKAYTYEQRVDLFNAFQISMSQKYFCPFFSFISLHVHRKRDLFSIGYSHSGNVSSVPQAANYVKFPIYDDGASVQPKVEQRTIGRFSAVITIIRNIDSQTITVVKGQVGMWDIRFNPCNFSFTMSINWERFDKIKPDDRHYLKSNIVFDRDEAELFLKLTKFK